MAKKPTYKELEQRVKELEKEARKLKETQEELKKYQFIVESAHDAIFFKDLESRYIIANDKTLEIFGLSREEIIGKNDYELMPDIGEAKKNVYDDQIVFKSGKPTEILKYMTGVKGKEYWFQAIKVPQFDNDGKVVGLIGIARDITERRQAEEKLKLFRELIERSNDAIEVVDPETGRFFDVNDKGCADLGYSREEFLALRVPDIDPNMAPSSYTVTVKKLRKAGSLSMETLHLRKDRTTFPVEINLSYVQLDRDYIVTVARNITERKRAEEAMQESEKRYRELFENSTDFVYTLDLKGNFTDVNKAAEDLTGYTKNELIGMNYREYTPEDTYERISKAFKGIIDEGKPLKDFPLEVTIKDGTKRYFETCVSPLKKGKEIIGFQGSSRDITEHKRADEALQESEAKYRTILETIEEGYYETDIKGNFTFFNDSICKISGYTRDELMGMNNRDYIPTETAKRVYRIFNKIYRTGKPEKMVVHELIKKDGSKIVVEASASLIRDPSGQPVGFRGIVRDITEEKKLEAQLQQAQKMEAIGTLAGGVAHDFNNILTTIIGNAELMLMTTPKNELLHKEIKEIKTAGERAASLTRQLLAFSRKQIIQPKILDLNTLLAGIEKMLVRLIGENIEFLIIPESALWQVEIDPGQMEQVIMNLAINAKDAMPNGGKLTIQTANTDLSESYFTEHGIVKDQAEPYVMVAISDTGIGMDKEIQEHIFEPFYSTKEKGKGTGLGLSTVYGIVKQNSGFIWVYSEPGQGSTFKMYLPRAKDGVKAEEKEQTPVENLGGSETVLIIEDDALLLNFARKALQQYGYKVLTAKSGEEALRISKEYEGPIDLTATDVIMTTMSGKETAERLQPIYPQMKVIYMSGYTDNSIVHFGVLAPGLNFLEKPFSPEDLARKVREVLDK